MSGTENKVVEMVEKKLSTSGTAAAEPLQSRALFWPDLKGFPRPKYLIKGVIDVGCFGEIFGPTGSGKSFFAIDMGLHVAAGCNWSGCRVKKAGVLYVSAEGGAAIISRMEAWQRHCSKSLDALPFAVVLDQTDLLTSAGAEQVIADAAKVPDLGLVFVDTAARTMPGGDEGAEAMSNFVAACDKVRAETGAAVVVVHHTGKDVSKGSRGSTVRPAAVDTAIEVMRNNTTKIGTATITKARDGETGAAFPFRLEVIDLGKDGDDDAVTGCVAVEAEAPTFTAAGPKLNENQETVFALLKDAGQGGLTLDEWNERAREAGIGEKRRADLTDIRMALKRKNLVYKYADKWFVQ